MVICCGSKIFSELFICWTLLRNLVVALMKVFGIAALRYLVQRMAEKIRKLEVGVTKRF